MTKCVSIVTEDYIIIEREQEVIIVVSEVE